MIILDLELSRERGGELLIFYKYQSGGETCFKKGGEESK